MILNPTPSAPPAPSKLKGTNQITNNHHSHPPPSRRSPRRGPLRRALRTGLITLASLTVLWQLLPSAFPLPARLLAGPAPSPLLLDRSGQILDDVPRLDYFRHRPAILAEIPRDLVHATLAAEDKRFYQHNGADYRATARAIYQSIDLGRFVSGASTITQQTIKITSPPTKRNFRAKFREILTARHLESHWSKDQILTAYLNNLDYGSHRQGSVEAAAHFFGKPLTDLSLAEAALLAGLPQAPSRLNPFRNPEGALKRRNWILSRLRIVFNYEESRINAALREPLQLRHSSRPSPAPHLAATFRSSPHYRSGGTIHTTLDGDLQRELNQIVTTELARLANRNVQQAAVVVLHNPSGELRAMIGSSDYHDPSGGQVNGALAPRSAGSTLKPFTYLLAFDHGGLFPGSIIGDIPTPFQTGEGLDAPTNYDHHHYGPVTVRHALANSLNVAAMRTLNQTGGPAPLHALLQELGCTTLTRPVADYGLGLTIGNAEVRLAELTNAFATLARLGKHLPISVLSDSSSSQITTKTSPITPSAAYLIADVLSDNAARSAAFGHRSALRLPFRCAVKTGTSSDFRDNWCLGYTAEFTVGVWVGNFDNTPMRGISGVSGAGPIFHRTMRLLHRDTTPTWMPQPTELVAITIDPRTGHRFLQTPRPGTPHTALELCHREQLPLPVSSRDYNPSGRAILDQSYQEWFASADNLRRTDFTLASRPAPELTPRIISPPANSTYLLDPELPTRGQRLKLVSNLPDKVQWSSPTLTLDGHTALLTPGTHTLTLLHPPTGRSTSRTITVESL